MAFEKLNEYFEDLVPIIRNPIGDFLSSNIKELLEDSIGFLPDGMKTAYLTGSLSEELSSCSQSPDIDFLGPIEISTVQEAKFKHLKNNPGFVLILIENEEDARFLTNRYGKDVFTIIDAPDNETANQWRCVNPDAIWRSDFVKEGQKRICRNVSTSFSSLEVDTDIEGPTYPAIIKKTACDEFSVNYDLDIVCGVYADDKFSEETLYQWQQRKPRCWPDRDTAEDVLTTGLFIVPKTSVGGDSKLEWRLSFSMQEMILCKSMSKIQKTCYKFLKTLCRVEINESDILRSYYLKTVMFWVLERLPSNQKCEKHSQSKSNQRRRKCWHDQGWTEKNIGERILDLLTALISHLKSGELPNYFVPDMNLLKGTSKQDLDVVLQKSLDLEQRIMRFSGVVEIQKSCFTKSWIEIIYCGIKEMVKFKVTAVEKYFIIKKHQEKAWKYFSLVIWIRFLRKFKPNRKFLEAILCKLREDKDVEEFFQEKEDCWMVGGPYELLEYIRIDDREKSWELYKKEFNVRITFEKFDLIIGALKFEWDFYQVTEML